MIKVLYKMNTLLGKDGYDLSQVMAVAGIDKGSTVAGYGGNFAGTTTAKTGSVNKAKTLAGTVNTKNGTIYFAVLMHTDSRADWGAASATIKAKVNDLIVDNGGGRKINYTEILPLPFDKNSSLNQTSVVLTNR
jgi:D-alanyl-D-alanine carboxypeptidase